MTAAAKSLYSYILLQESKEEYSLLKYPNVQSDKVAQCLVLWGCSAVMQDGCTSVMDVKCSDYFYDYFKWLSIIFMTPSLLWFQSTGKPCG